MNTYVVSGVTGHVGSVVASELLDRGKKIRVIVRNPKQGEEWSRRGAEVAVGSLDDRAFLATTLANAAGFFTLLPGNPMAPDFRAGLARLAHAIAAAVKDSRVPHVVLLSSVGADLLDAPTGPISSLHHLENALRATGTRLTAIRAGYFQENIASAISPATQAGVFPNFLPSADFALPMIATRDIGGVAARALLEPPARSEVVDLAGPLYSARQLADKLGARLGKPLQIVDIPPAGHVAALKQAGLPADTAEAYAEMHAAIAAGLVTPKGDRSLTGTTTIDEVLPGLLAGSRS
jgi:uncharacterized protein YbjT (DUF2867 family)